MTGIGAILSPERVAAKVRIPPITAIRADAFEPEGRW
jgi:hypothetical protein